MIKGKPGSSKKYLPQPKTKDGKEFIKEMTDKTIRVFDKVGKFYPRLLELDDQLHLDFRYFYENDNGLLNPTRTGYRYNLKAVRVLYRVLRELKRYLDDQGMWAEEAD